MTVVIDDKELAVEFAKRVAVGLAKAAKSMCPTQENIEGKKEHVDVAILDNSVYVGRKLATHIGCVQVDLASFCKKKSKLRDILQNVSIKASINYNTLNNWIKLNGAAVQKVTIGDDYMLLTCVENVVEFRMAWQDRLQSNVDDVISVVSERIFEHNLIARHTLEREVTENQIVLAITPEGMEFRPFFINNDPATQLRLRHNMIPAGEVTLSVYSDPLGDRIVHLKADSDIQTVNQYYRVLQI